MISCLRTSGVWVVGVVCAAILAAGARAATVDISSGTLIAIPSNGIATPYPSSIVVTGNPNEVVTGLKVELRGLTHTFPDDLDILLVSPAGQWVTLMSDSGGGGDVSSITLGFDDAAPAKLTDTATLSTGTNLVTNYEGVDPFPAPAPGNSPVIATNLAALIGTSVNGNWRLYVLDDAAGDEGSIATGWRLTLTTEPAPAPKAIISEFRLRGPSSGTDEYMEIHNASDRPLVVESVDGSAGWALASANGILFVVTNGTVLPARGHFLGVNSAGYSLLNVPAGPGTTAAGDILFLADVADNAGLALFRSASPTNLNLGTRLDAVGSTLETNTLFKEGVGYPALSAADISLYSIESAFIRNRSSGSPKDSDDNAADFLYLDTGGWSIGAGQRLGAPGPENLSSPQRLATGDTLLEMDLLHPPAGVTGAPNRVRSFVSDPPNNSSLGTLAFNRKFTNKSAANLTRLRFRIVDLTTFSSPPGNADLRVRSSVGSQVPLGNGSTSFVGAAVLEVPPFQPTGGGFNSALSASSISVSNPLLPGASVLLQFLLGVEQAGHYRFAIIPEAVPGLPSEAMLVVGDTETAGGEVESGGGEVIRNVQFSGGNPVIEFSASPIQRYLFQFSTNFFADTPTWTTVTGTNAGGYGTLSLTGETSAAAGMIRVISAP
jgi:subtilisin-like proprotein convertase family protein